VLGLASSLDFWGSLWGRPIQIPAQDDAAAIAADWAAVGDDLWSALDNYHPDSYHTH